MKERMPDQVLTLSHCLQDTLSLPNGARFYLCALQINPFAYIKRQGITTPFTSEDEYNSAVIQTCIDIGIEVIAVTDHYRVEDSIGLVQAARNMKLHAFCGFEAVSKDGVHFLCLFAPDKDNFLDRYIGEFGIHDSGQLSPIGSKDAIELLESVKDWGTVCIAAHIASKGGLLKKLSGQSRVKVWTHPDLLACALPGPVRDAPDECRHIIQNKDAQHKRDRPIAVVNASDINSPDDLRKNGASCFIKMSTVSVEAFRQAFLDSDSRIRLHSDAKPTAHAELLAMTWVGGFLSNTSVHFNENLNVLIGGRGTGKSTMIESIRYVLGLEPFGEEARKVHENVVRYVLRSGTKISLKVRSLKPSKHCYTIERSVPNPPVVKDESGEILALSPRDVIPGVEVFGQHEISELTKSPQKLTLLLKRFVDQEVAIVERKTRVRLELERSRNRIVDVNRRLRQLDEELAELPVLEELQRRFQEVGIELRLKEKSLLVREESLLANLDERVDQYRALHTDLTEGLPVDTVFVSDQALDMLPNADILSEIKEILGTLSFELTTLDQQFGKSLTEVDKAIKEIKSRWAERKTTIEENYERLLRELHKSNVDGEEFIQLRKQVEHLRPLNDRVQRLKSDLKAYKLQRCKLLAEWQDIKAAEYKQIEAAAKQVSQKLRNRVQVSIKRDGNRDPLEQLLREEVGGNLTAAMERLRGYDQLSLCNLAQHCREGKEVLSEIYNLPPRAAERIAQADSEIFMRIEELELPTTTEIKLNTALKGRITDWQSLQALSTGQKATAVLLLLLLESEAPLVVDQPEDDLDNRFITEGIVPIMRQEKRRRQFIFSTHNANIPVLGDAELILGLTAIGGAEQGQGRVTSEHMGSIDSSPVRELIEEVLEGGKAAFEMRRSKYGF